MKVRDVDAKITVWTKNVIYGGNSLVEQERRDDSLSWGRILKKKCDIKSIWRGRKGINVRNSFDQICKYHVLLLQFQKINGWIRKLYLVGFFSPHWCSFTSCNWKLIMQILGFFPLHYDASAACCKIETRKNIPPCKWANEKECKRPNRYYSKNVKTVQWIWSGSQPY